MYILLLWIGIKFSMPALYFFLLGLFWSINILEYLQRRNDE